MRIVACDEPFIHAERPDDVHTHAGPRGAVQPLGEVAVDAHGEPHRITMLAGQIRNRERVGPVHAAFAGESEEHEVAVFPAVHRRAVHENLHDVV